MSPFTEPLYRPKMHHLNKHYGLFMLPHQDGWFWIQTRAWPVLAIFKEEKSQDSPSSLGNDSKWLLFFSHGESLNKLITNASSWRFSYNVQWVRNHALCTSHTHPHPHIPLLTLNLRYVINSHDRSNSKLVEYIIWHVCLLIIYSSQRLNESGSPVATSCSW